MSVCVCVCVPNIKVTIQTAAVMQIWHGTVNLERRWQFMMIVTQEHVHNVYTV